MKKVIIIILAIVIVAVAIVLFKYYDYKAQKSEIETFNVQYEQYLDKELYGADIASVINKAVDDNEKAGIEKDENEKYIQNDENSVNIEVKIIDLEEDTIFAMETLYSGGMEQFVQYYSMIMFECTEIKYNSAGYVSYMLFEQITT